MAEAMDGKYIPFRHLIIHFIVITISSGFCIDKIGITCFTEMPSVILKLKLKRRLGDEVIHVRLVCVVQSPGKIYP